MISSSSTLGGTLFTSHVETALVEQTAQLKKVNIRALVTSHMEDLELVTGNVTSSLKPGSELLNNNKHICYKWSIKGKV